MAIDRDIIKGRTRCTGRAIGIVFLALVNLPAFFGCASPRQTAPAVDPATLSDDAFQAYLATVDVVTVDEAYRTMLILADGEDGSKTFDERRQKLEQRGVSKAAWNLKPENTIDIGSVSYMICKICKISGGVDMNTIAALGVGDRRYATRELIYREMIEDAVDYQYMTGARMVGLLGKADALMAKRGLYPNQGIDLSDETDRDEQGRLIVPAPTSRPEN